MGQSALRHLAVILYPPQHTHNCFPSQSPVPLSSHPVVSLSFPSHKDSLSQPFLPSLVRLPLASGIPKTTDDLLAKKGS